MNKNLIIVCALGMLSIILGAFGAHALKDKLTPDALQSFETGVRYQIYHAIVLLFVNMFQGFSPEFKTTLTITFLVGILFFSGSIYLIHLAKVPAKSIWFVTPLGGLILIVGWGMMLYHFIKS